MPKPIRSLEKYVAKTPAVSPTRWLYQASAFGRILGEIVIRRAS